MADRGIRIPFVADVADWLRGTSKVERSLDDLGGDLDQLARRADDNADDIARDFGTAFRRIEDDADRSGRAAGRNLDDGLRRSTFRGTAGALAAEAGSEFVESWGEAIRSGDPTEVIREVGSNLALIGAAVGGPIGAAAGLAGSLFVTQFIDKAARLNDAVGTLVTEVFQGAADKAAEEGASIAEALTNAFVTEQQKNQALQDFYGVDNLLDAVVRATDDAATLGVTFDTVRDAVGSVGAEQRAAAADLQEAQTQAQGLKDRYDAVRDAVGEVIGRNTLAYQEAAKGIAVADELIAQADRLAAANDRAADAAQRVADSWRGSVDAIATARQEAEGLERAVTVGVLNKLDSAGLLSPQGSVIP